MIVSGITKYFWWSCNFQCLYTNFLQMEATLVKMKISFVSLDTTPQASLASDLDRKPVVVVASIESLLNKDIRPFIRRLEVTYIAVDECQVNIWQF